MKKITALLLSVMMLISVSACGGSSSSSSVWACGGSSSSSEDSRLDSTPLTDLMAEILDGVADLPDPLLDTDLTTDEMKQSFPYVAFTDYIDGMEAVSSDAAINAIAHSVVLLRVPEGTDVQEIADDIEANADPRKWLCVEAEKVSVSTNGRLVLLVMSSEATTDAITENFLALK